MKDKNLKEFFHSNIYTGTLLNTCVFFVLLSLSNKLYASSNNLYDFLWLDPDKKVYVLQNKVYAKKNRTYLNIGYISDMSSNYYDTNGVHLLIGHYLSEEWSIEAFYHKYSNSTNNTYENLVEINGVVPFSRQIKQSYGLIALWSPFYGKINTFNKIFYFDWSIGAGVTNLKAQSNARTVSNPDVSNVFEEEEDLTAGVIKTGVRFHATENMHIGIDFKRTQYRAEGVILDDVPAEKSWRGHNEIIFSLGFSF